MSKFEYDRPIVLSLAGFDPTGGAGVLADVKTFEQFKCLGMGVISANTIQVEDEFISVKWKSIDEIKEQCLPILTSYKVSVVKIGIIDSTSTLKKVIDYIFSFDPAIQIIWDPVIASSSGFGLLTETSSSDLQYILEKIKLITPNFNEYKLLSDLLGFELSDIAKLKSSILLKGGHNPHQTGTDILFNDGKEIVLEPTSNEISPKHGSGCILSSAIAAGLANSLSLESACREGKNYIENRLKSNTNLLAYHVA